jgi:catechol 2,3-dioxygenase-like lactoylglutathione lyase family enzyme
MQTVNKLMMLAIGVSDMPKAKAFYADKLGLKVMTDYRQDDDHWWVSLSLPEGGVTITLTTFHGNAKPGTMTLWFATSDLGAAHKALSDKGVQVSEVGDDLHGPGSGVKWFNFKDPDGNLVHLEQA